MIAAPGLQCGFGDPLGNQILENLRALGYTIIRIDLQRCDQTQTAALAQEVLDAGLQPLCIIRRPEQITVLPEGALIELGNEPNLEHEGWTVEDYVAVASECVTLAIHHNRRLYLGAVSNLDRDGFSFLQKLPWDTYPASNVGCSIHRYPETDGTPATPHTGWSSREDEVMTLRSIVGPRPLVCSEVGYHDDAAGWTPDEVATNMAWERRFFSEQGFEVCVGYQINDGPDDGDHQNYYGFRRNDGSWKPVAYAFINVMLTVPVTTTLLASSGFYLTAESGGGGIVVADREHAGPWETWGVITHDDDRVALRAHNGQYLSAQPDGTVVANRSIIGEWELFTIELRDDIRVAFLSAHGTYLGVNQGGGTPVPAVCEATAVGEWELFTSSTMFWEAPLPVVQRPLVGPLRVEARLFRDDTGFRRVFFCSWFPALRILRDNPTEFYRQLDAIVAAGYQGIRVFLAVGGWMEYWDGREVVPITFTKWYWTGNHLRTERYGDTMQAWPDYDDLLRELLRACVERKLRLHLTTGDMQMIAPDPAVEIDLARRFARIVGEEGGLDVVALVEVTNEFPLNRYGGDSDASIEQMGKVLDVWTNALPGLLVTAQGAIPQNEEPESLERASTFGTTCAVHVTREPVQLCLKRTLGLVYWEGDYRAFPKPFWEGEPAGPGEDSYARLDDPATLTALYALHALTGQASVRFQGAAVRSFQPLESEWGFYELPALFDAHLPEDIATWDHGSNQRGGIEYWWKDRDFRTAVYADWDPSPPRPIESWTLYTGTDVIHGTGNPVHGTTHLAGKGAPKATGFVVGKFAA